MKETISVVATKSTTALYLLSRIVNVDYDKLVCLYEIYKEDIFCIFFMLSGENIKFENGTTKYFPDDKIFGKIFERAQNILEALQGYPRQIRRYDMKYYRSLESMYRNGKYIVEVDNG